MFIILKGKDDKDEVEYKWDLAVEMMSKPKKFIDEC